MVIFKNKLLFLTAILVGVIFSISWLYPLYIQIKSKGQFSFVPIRYAPHTEDDAYFYYSHIREILDGNFPSHDPCTYENKDKLSPHIPYTFSLLMCSLGGLITKNTSHAYYFNYFVYPAINFLVIYYLLFLITNSRYTSILSSISVIFMEIPFRPKNLLYFVKNYLSGEDILRLFDLQRTPDILFTNIHIFSFVILLFLIFEKRKKSIFLNLSLIFCLGISSLISVQNFFISYAIYLFVMMVYFCERGLRTRIIIYLFVALIISLPGIIFMIKTSPVFIKVISDMYRAPGFISTGIIPKFFMAGLKLLFIPFLFLFFVSFPYKKFILSVLSGIILTYLFLTFFSGTYASGKVVKRGAELLVASLVMGSIIALIKDVLDKKKLLIGVFSKKIMTFNFNWSSTFFLNGKALRRNSRIAIIFLSLVFLAFCLFNQYQTNIHTYKYYNDPEFKTLYSWSMKSTNINEVALTLDFYLLTNLPVYSPLNVYIPQAVLSPTPAEERYRRFYETLRFYGVTTDELKLFLDRMRPINRLDPQDDYFHVQVSLMELVLFYGRFYYTQMSDSEKGTMLEEYSRIFKDKNRKLTFKADYLIISAFDESFVRPGSEAEKVIKRNNIVFRNKFYKVYKI